MTIKSAIFEIGKERTVEVYYSEETKEKKIKRIYKDYPNAKLLKEDIPYKD